MTKGTGHQKAKSLAIMTESSHLEVSAQIIHTAFSKMETFIYSKQALTNPQTGSAGQVKSCLAGQAPSSILQPTRQEPTPACLFHKGVQS